MAVSAGEARTILPSPWPKDPRVGSGSLTPDARRFVFSLAESKSDAWAIQMSGSVAGAYFARFAVNSVVWSAPSRCRVNLISSPATFPL